MNYITDNPSDSFSIELPITTQKDIDDRVVSYWIEGELVLLQISSYIRVEGKQVPAIERMANRIKQDRIEIVQNETIDIPFCPDIVGISYLDDKDVKWFFFYAVWPDLTILCTISGQPYEIEMKGNWAFVSIKSIRRI